jgi:hypothetical protein
MLRPSNWALRRRNCSAERRPASRSSPSRRIWSTTLSLPVSLGGALFDSLLALRRPKFIGSPAFRGRRAEVIAPGPAPATLGGRSAERSALDTNEGVVDGPGRRHGRTMAAARAPAAGLSAGLHRRPVLLPRERVTPSRPPGSALTGTGEPESGRAGRARDAQASRSDGAGPNSATAQIGQYQTSSCSSVSRSSDR